MIEVFKTNVSDKIQADILRDKINKEFTNYKAHFDLEDCDKILRVESKSEAVHPLPLITLLNKHGFSAEVLPD